MFRQLWSRLFRQRSFADDPVVRRAFIDQLTGLPTRYVFTDTLNEMRESGIGGVVVMIDVDHFKSFNDEFGHSAGDALLQIVARRLRDTLPEAAMLARLGGDEFMVFFPQMTVEQVQVDLERCRDRLRSPCGLEAAPNETVTMSYGVASFSGQGLDDVLRAADVACYAAKARGRNRVVVFDEDTRKVIQARRELASTVAYLHERNRELEGKVYTDALTGLKNRRALDEILEQTLGTEACAWDRAAVAFIDIDSFGSYNKLATDAKGDEALQQIAACIRTAARTDDLAFRKGGEELVLVFPGVTAQDARTAAERVRQKVQALGISHPGSTVAPVLTVTIGLAFGGGGQTMRSVMNAAADQAMAAKVNGQRNRVHCIDAME